MKIFRVKASIYNYWWSCDKDGFSEKEKFFTSKEKAEKWIDDHKDFIYGPDGPAKATKGYQMPSFKIEKIEVE